MTLDELPDGRRVLARLVARGYTAAEAAHVLGLTEAEVRTELDGIYEQLAIQRHADLVELVRANPEPLPAGFTSFDWSSISRGRRTG